MKKAALLLVCTGACLVVAACSSGGDPGPAPYDSNGTSEGSVTLHEGTSVVDAPLADVADVRADRVVFPASAFAALSAHKPADILLSDRQAAGAAGKNPEGFLRRVQSVTQSAEGTVVMTTPATLQEAVDSLVVHTKLSMPDLTTEGPAPASIGNGLDLHPLGKGGTTVKLLDYSGKSLFEVKDTAKGADGSDVPYIVYANVDTGTLGFTPTYEFDADVGFLELKSFKVVATGKLDAKLVLAAGVKFDPSLDPKKAAALAGKPLTKSFSTTLADYDVSLGSIGLGGIKLPASAHYTTTLNCDFSFTAPVEAKVGGTASGSITVGLSYADGKLTPSFDKSATLAPTPPVYTKEGMMRAYCTVSPKFALKFFGVATAELTANAYAGVGASQTCGGKDASGTKALVHGDAEAGVSAKVLAKVDLFGLYKWKKECTLFDVGGKVQYDTTYPYPGGAAATCTVAGPFPLPPPVPANPASCFGESDPGSTGGTGGTNDPNAVADAGADASTPLIPGTCTHDVCVAGEKLGQACDACTMKVCAADSYCCDTFWGLSCFDSVLKYCGKTCGR
ncbi:MAG TPA: hypothetical protein VLT33_49985 [Labilithrix sp.]|nr:hypothetical protein [Labilithrix sp.]